MNDKLLNKYDLHEWLGVKLSTLREWRQTGKGPKYIKLNRLVRYKKADVDRWIDEESHPK